MRYRLATYRECKAHREWNTTCPDCGRRGKAMQYNPLTGHRVKDGEGSAMSAGSLPSGEGGGRGRFPVNWAHRMRLYGEPSDLVVPQCLFGLSLLTTEHTDCSDSLQDGNSIPQDVNPCNPRHPWSENNLREIGVVESEKTALILSSLPVKTICRASLQE